jgi:hypothetical protein
MLYIVLTNGVERQWHVDQKLSGLKLSGLLDSISLVKEVQADGHELEWIQENISGIPFCKPEVKRVQCWYGEHAKFIANCIPLKG